MPISKIIKRLTLGLFGVTLLSSTGIRSRYQRQILTWLNDNSASVSGISKSINIRTPHTSHALSELRKRGLVHRDDTHGIRGAIHSITELGKELLEQSRLSLYRKYASSVDQEFDGMLLEANGQELLLCYHKTPPSSLIPLPLDPFDRDLEQQSTSSGTEGVIWASVVPESVIWYSADNLERITPPAELSFNTLDAWLQTTDSFALVRARLFTPAIQWNVPPGTKFKMPSFTQSQLPRQISSGEFSIGNVPDSGIEVFWTNRLHAHLHSEVDINLLINGFSKGAMVLRNNPIKPDVPNLPIGAVLEWLRRRHKRISEESLQLKFEQIKSFLIEGSIKSLSSSLQRELSRDFGHCQWVHDIANNIEVSNISTNGLVSILAHIRSNYSIDYIVEWDWDISFDYDFLDHLIRDSRCRLLITKTGPAKEINSSLAMLKSLPSLAMTELFLPNQHVINIELNSSAGQQNSVAHNKIPDCAVELLESYDYGAWDLSKMSGSSSDVSFTNEIWQALSKYPEGDESWSNEIELSNPLAAWIATPTGNRPSRWVRVSSRIHGEWVDLLDCQDTPPNLLISGLDSASQQWKMAAIQQLSIILMRDNHSLIGLKKALESPVGVNALSTAILLACQQLGDDFVDYVNEAVDEWLDAPLFATEVLTSLFTRFTDGELDRFKVFDKMLIASKIHPKNSVLFNWGRYIDCLQSKELISNELARGFMSTLPHKWWYSNAPDWLVGQLSSSVGRRWLEQQKIPWPAMIFRQNGEACGPPGFSNRYIRRVPSSADLLFIPIMPDCPGKAYLMDTYDLAAKLEDQNHRVTARTHPKLEYLIAELSNWPDLSHSVIDEGDTTIGSLLFGISYHKNIE